jgi:ferritin-like metal-binding protein YciE
MARQTTKRGGAAASRKGRSGRAAGSGRSASRSTGGAKSTRKSASGRSASARAASRARAASQANKEKDLGDLFLDTLKDMYHAEKQLLRALPKMAKAAQSGELRNAFANHARETEVQAERLERIFEMSGKRPQTKPCHGMMGLVEEGTEVMSEFKGSDALDAGLIAAAQAVEHYEISRYGALKAWAEQHGMQEVADILDESLAEEKNADELLNRIAEQEANRRAA